MRGQVEGLCTAPRFVAKDPTAPSLAEQNVGERRRSSATTARSQHLLGVLRERAGIGPPGRRRPPRRARRRPVRPRRCASTPTCWPTLAPVRAARAAAPAAQPRADRARSSSARPSCRRSPASTPRSTAPTPRSRRCSRLPYEMYRAGRAPLRLPRPVLRVHRVASCRPSTPRPRRVGPSCCTWATARACARCRRPQRRQHDGLHRGRRPA